MKSLFKRLFCRHNWEQYMYNVPTQDWVIFEVISFTNREYPKTNPPRGALITLCFYNCRKCASWKWVFVFGNEKGTIK